MRQAGQPRRIVHAADTEPEHLRNDGRAMIGHHHDLHAVLQRELEDVIFLRLRRNRKKKTGGKRRANEATR
jgi:hypothetical protein